MTTLQLRIMAQVLPFLLLAPAVAPAQAPTRGEATSALHAANQPAANHYTRQQIDQMVAPIALYPDELLSQVLMAATYPDQIVEAAQWLQDPSHASLNGDALVAALEPLPWDPSIKALAAFPQVIVMLSQHIEWTQALGVAFATQQPEVMQRVQALRHLAMKSGKLKKVRHLAVREEGPAIVIVSEEPDRVFVPVYNPTVVYGEWPDPGFQPVYLPPPREFVAETIEPGFEVSTGFAIVAPLWGWSRPDWRDHRITVDRTRVTRFSRNVTFEGDTWHHRGAVVLAAPPSARPAGAAAALPAGTVAPAAAAAVVALPQRAAREPQQIQTRSAATTAPAAAQPNQAPASTTHPGAAQPAQTATTPPTGAAHNGAADRGKAEAPTATGTTPTGTTPTGKAVTTATPSAHPAAEAGKTEHAPVQRETTTAPKEAQPSNETATRAAHPNEAAKPSATAKPGEARAGHPATGAAMHPETMAPGKEAQPAEHRAAAPASTPTAVREQQRQEQMGGKAPPPAAEHREPMRTAPEHAAAPPSPSPQPPVGHAEHAVPPQPEHSQPQQAQHPQPQQPQHPQPQQAQHPAPAPEPAGHGSSSPPQAAGPKPMASPAAQPPHEAGKPSGQQQEEKPGR